ncbi:MAG: hypothetical protein AW12_02516 [Candidatus Accumulibacter sp. BA-94]|jgi:hypothetical protein|nr:MAG: hypothetical protein AW12_02516 [Candidatus Accumulibacter sp. BA-94]
MDLSKHDHSQMNDEWLKKPPAKLFLEMWKQLLHDVKELQDRLNEKPDSSSCPPTSQPPCATTGGSERNRVARRTSAALQPRPRRRRESLPHYPTRDKQ